MIVQTAPLYSELFQRQMVDIYFSRKHHVFFSYGGRKNHFAKEQWTLTISNSKFFQILCFNHDFLRIWITIWLTINLKNQGESDKCHDAYKNDCSFVYLFLDDLKKCLMCNIQRAFYGFSTQGAHSIDFKVFGSHGQTIKISHICIKFGRFF